MWYECENKAVETFNLPCDLSFLSHFGCCLTYWDTNLVLHSISQSSSGWYILAQTLASPGGTSKLYEQVAQMPITLQHYLLSPSPHLWCHEVTYDQLSEKEKLKLSLQYAGTIQKLTDASLQACSIWPWKKVVKRNIPVGKILISAPDSLCLKGEMTGGTDLHWFMSLTNSFTECSGIGKN